MPWTGRAPAHRILEDRQSQSSTATTPPPPSRNRRQEILRGRRPCRRSQRLHRLRTEIPPLCDRPLVVLLEQDGADEPNHRARVREDAADVRAACDVLIQSFQRSGAVQLALVRQRKVPVGQHVLGRVLKQGRRRGEPASQPVGDLPQLVQRRRVIRLREDGPHNRRDRLPGALRHRRAGFS